MMYRELYEGTLQKTITDATAGNDNITSIGDYLFYGCSTLERVSFPNVTTVGAYAFYNAKKLASVYFPNLATINQYAFWYCPFTSFEAPNLTRLDAQVFKYTGLKSVSFPLLATVNSTAQFQGCYSLATVRIPLANAISSTMFYGCKQLTAVTACVAQSVGANAFNGCSKLAVLDLSLGAAVATLDNTNAFGGVPSTCKVVVPDSLVADYKAAGNWATYADYIIGRCEAVEGGLLA